MIFKEKGYDEFLFEKIQNAELSMQEGKAISKEQMQNKMQALFAELESEQNEREQFFSREAVYG